MGVSTRKPGGTGRNRVEQGGTGRNRAEPGVGENALTTDLAQIWH